MVRFRDRKRSSQEIFQLPRNPKDARNSVLAIQQPRKPDTKFERYHGNPKAALSTGVFQRYQNTFRSKSNYPEVPSTTLDNTNNNGEWTLVTRRRRQQTKRRPVAGVSGGHRGEPRHPWWRGPRELPPSERGQLISLFIEGIPHESSIVDLRKLFEQYGKVRDIYISGKKRKNTESSFGFVRYENREEAKKAIAKVHNTKLHGHTLKVNFAKFQKGGVPVKEVTSQEEGNMVTRQGVFYPAQRNHRNYAEVVRGYSKTIRPPLNNTNSEERNCTKVKLIENEMVKERLKVAVVIEVEEEEDMEHAVTSLKGMNISILDFSHLTPFKFVAFFENELRMVDAMKTNSPLLMAFPKARKWSENEKVVERCAWLECRGLDPRCWSEGNLKIIGQKWGTVIRIENGYNGLNSITAARLLVKTEHLNKIHGSVEVEWVNGSYTVWVEEIFKNEGMNTQIDLSSDEDDDDESDDNDETNENIEKMQMVDLNDKGDDDHNVTDEMEEDGNVDFEDKEEDERHNETVDCTVNADQQFQTMQPMHNLDGQNVQQRGLELDTQQCINVDVLGNDNDTMCEHPFEVRSDKQQGQNSNGQQILGTQKICEEHPLIDKVSKVVEEEEKTNELVLEHMLMNTDVQNGAAMDLESDSLKLVDNNDDQLVTDLGQRFELHKKLVSKEVGEGSQIATAINNSGEECQWVTKIISNGLDNERFDPILAVECFLSQPTAAVARIHTIPQKPKRGRPKRVAQSLPEPLYVPSTPPNSSVKANDTWHTVKKIGVKSRNEKGMISEIRRSKRFLVMEETSQ
ncbi:unnamed protein product [Amaranthus hypochondriacus]